MWSQIHALISPKNFFLTANTALPWLCAAFVVLFSYGLIGGLWLAPADYQQGDAFRIIYIHAPCAFLSLFVYAVMSGAAAIGFIWRVKLAFLVMRHSAPIGASFALLALITGSIWGKPMWGTWWIWDARLTSELILLFIYLAIILFQGAIKQKKSGERATAILTLVGFIDLPIIHYSVYWWNTLHQGPTLKIFAPSAIDSSMIYPLLAMLIAFAIYYAIVLILRLNYELIAQDANHHWLKERK